MWNKLINLIQKCCLYVINIFVLEKANAPFVNLSQRTKSPYVAVAAFASSGFSFVSDFYGNRRYRNRTLNPCWMKWRHYRSCHEIHGNSLVGDDLDAGHWSYRCHNCHCPWSDENTFQCQRCGCRTTKG